jgi:hypothetical protein
MVRRCYCSIRHALQAGSTSDEIERDRESGPSLQSADSGTLIWNLVVTQVTSVTLVITLGRVLFSF